MTGVVQVCGGLAVNSGTVVPLDTKGMPCMLRGCFFVCGACFVFVACTCFNFFNELYQFSQNFTVFFSLIFKTTEIFFVFIGLNQFD